MCVQDWKHFLRLKIDADGSLTIFPIGISRVARTFRKAQSSDRTDSWFVPVDSERPSLIEDPLRIPTR